MDPVLTPPKGPGTSKIIDIISKKKTIVFKEIVLLSLSRFWTSFWHPLGHPFGSLLASKMAETTPSSRRKTALEGSRSPHRRLPRCFSEGLQEPKMLQDGTKMAPGPIWEPVLPYLAAILGPCRSDSGASLRGLPETVAAATPSLTRSSMPSTIGP